MLQKIIQRKTLISMLFIGMTLLGIISYDKLPLELLPNTELPFLVVQVSSFRNADPQYTEREAIIPLEGAIGSIPDIEKIESYADRRRSGITVYFKSGANMKYAYLRLQEKVDKIKPTLPEGFLVNVFKIDTELLSNMFMNIQIRGSGGIDRIRYITDKEILEPLNAIDGVVNVEIFGGREKTIEIILDSEIAESYGITPGSLRGILARNNSFKRFTGYLEESGLKYFVNVNAEYDDVNVLENIVIKPEIPLLLKDISTIRFGLKEETSISRVNGKESVTAQIVRDNQANIIALAEEVNNVIDRLNKKLESKDITLVIEFDSSEILKTNMDLIKELALIGGLLAVLILWFFLRHFRLVSVIALAIPISVLTSFFFFYLFDITLNSLTLVGMALAIGMLLDNSVVVLENIYRLAEKKKDPETAAIQGTKEVWRSIFAATLTTITVFLPFIFADNFMVQILGYQIGVSIISTLMVSLFVALLLIPMVTYFFLSRKKSVTGYDGFNRNPYISKVYFVFLKLTMRNPFTTIILTIIVFFLSLLSTLALSINVSNEPELKDFNLYVTMAAGSSLEMTDKTVAELEEMLNKVPEIEDIIAQIYEEEAVLSLKLKDDFRKLENHTIEDIKGSINEHIDNFRSAEVSFEEPESSSRYRTGGGRGGGGDMGGGMASLMGIGSSTETIAIKGQDMAMMLTLADDINYQLDNITSVNWSQVSVSEERPEIHMFPDRTLMENSGVTMNQISSELSSFENEITSGLTFKAAGEEYDIIIRNEDYAEKDMDDLQKMKVQNQSGAEYELQDISRLVYGYGTSRISRVNQERRVNVRYRFQQEITETSGYLEEARNDIDHMVEGFVLPAGLAIEVIHDENDLSDFYLLLAAAALLIYMILASVFESLLTPLVIMVTIPLAGIGSLWAIIFTGNSLLNANTLIGFLILLGIVVNNGIILLDYTRILRQQGFNRTRALMIAGSARLRPIFITAISTIIAMLPLAMGKAEYVTQIAAPFAVTVIGGLALSTVFTLILIPTVYTAFENTQEWFNNLSWQSRILQGVLLISGSIYTIINIESLIWILIDITLLIIVIPASTYFVTASLKRARADLIPEDKSITITISNLYKVYDLKGKFARDWQKLRNTKTDAAINKIRQRQNLALMTTILGFLFYFVYLYMESPFWVFVLAHVVYFYTLYFFGYINKFYDIARQSPIEKLLNYSKKLFVWGFPAFNLILYVWVWESITAAVFAGLFWYFTLSVYSSSVKISHHKIDINRISGRFSGIRKGYYRMAERIFAGLTRKPFRAVNGVSLTIEKGMFGLLGPNGAGKTTLMRTICGVLDQNYGTIRFNKIDSQEHREELQGIIGYLPQEFGTYENMTAREFLDYQAMMKGIAEQGKRKERIDFVLEAVHLTDNRNEKIGSFSGGMKQRVGIAQSLLHLPRVLVVDEPTAGLDPRERIRFRNLLVDLSRDRIVIFSTHIIEDISSSCDKVAVMNKGQVRYSGNPQDMSALADGKVWQVVIDPEEFDSFQKTHNVIHHIRIKDKLRIRCLAKESPHPEAIKVKPNLEDSYLWLAGSSIMTSISQEQ